jgi:diguanylate cyclase (GGDEF)-like protein
MLPRVMGDVALQIGLTAAYVGLGLLSFDLSQINDVVSEIVFIPEGFGLGMALLFGIRVWPAVFFGHLLLGYAQYLPIRESLLVGLANVAEVYIGVTVLKKLRFNQALANARDYILLVLTSALILQPFSRVMGAVYLALSSATSPTLSFLFGVLLVWSLGQAVWQILVAGSLLALADAVQRNRSIRHWLGFAAVMLLTAAVIYGLGVQLVHGSLHFVHVFSCIYLIMLTVTVMYDLAGAMIGNLLLLGLTQYMLHFDGHPLLESTDAAAQVAYLNVFLIGVLLNAGLVGALLKERGDREKRLKSMAHQDYLTGLHNRRHFIESAERELARLKRHRSDVGLICIDIDWFKQINDTHGHDAGDRVLVFFADILRRHLRSDDIAARLGGEEFAILAVEVGDVHHVADRLRSNLAAALGERSDIPAFTVSMGTTRLRLEDADISAALRRADAALYEAKRSGRNSIVCDDAKSQTVEAAGKS